MTLLEAGRAQVVGDTGVRAGHRTVAPCSRRDRAAGHGEVEPLTSREEELLIPVARGRTNSEIADELHISISTVKTHLASLMRKLDARNRFEIAMWAHETGRIKP